ncbi:hypothetical protein INR49_030373 [Caranx melampygus]|nr:hypothetical protein INR49_030373 [Caranx melampygus]
MCSPLLDQLQRSMLSIPLQILSDGPFCPLQGFQCNLPPIVSVFLSSTQRLGGGAAVRVDDPPNQPMCWESRRGRAAPKNQISFSFRPKRD